jgi:hypothetical protein
MGQSRGGFRRVQNGCRRPANRHKKSGCRDAMRRGNRFGAPCVAEFVSKSA